ncbi:MAG: hypothetical protein KatS3mg033_1920 [Thermonema sp.]|nr:MAG: hypothetical protein KatS3mg033_1920 [Thermonema sp.]
MQFKQPNNVLNFAGNSRKIHFFVILFENKTPSAAQKMRFFLSFCLLAQP